MFITLTTIQKAAMTRYNLILNLSQATDIMNKIVQDNKVQIIKNKILNLGKNFFESAKNSAIILSILLFLIFIFLAVISQTEKFPIFFWSTFQGFVFGLLTIHLFFYLFYLFELYKTSIKVMYINIASYNHSLNVWKI